MRGFVHISRVKDGKVEALYHASGAYQVDSTHRGRVVGYSAVDGLVYLSLEKSVLDQKYIRIEDVPVGEVVSGAVEKIVLGDDGVGGVTVKICEGIVGFVSSIHLADEICDHRILREIVQNHQVLVIKRGGCSFSEKLRNIAAYPPSHSALKLVIVVSYDEGGVASTSPSSLAAVRSEPYLIRPLLDEIQMTAGIPRPHLISMVMVGGGDETYELLRRAGGVGIRRRYSVHTQGIPINNVYIV